MPWQKVFCMFFSYSPLLQSVALIAVHLIPIQPPVRSLLRDAVDDDGKVFSLPLSPHTSCAIAFQECMCEIVCFGRWCSRKFENLRPSVHNISIASVHFPRRVSVDAKAHFILREWDKRERVEEINDSPCCLPVNTCHSPSR